MANKAPGDSPDTPAPELPRSRVLRFEVAPDTFAIFREAMLQLRRLAGGRLDDDTALLAMARHVLGGPTDEGRSSYQVSLSVCPACGGGAQSAAGELVPIDAAVVDMAACDMQHLGESLPLMPRVAEVRAANENASVDAGTPRQNSDQVHVGPPSRGENEAATNAAPPKQANRPNRPHRANATDARSSPRAKQSIPPALRRAVLTRDQRRCRVPGCHHATFVDVHHVQPRAEGGRNEASNLLTLCSAHHRAAHRGQLLIERGRERAITFRHADGAAQRQPDFAWTRRCPRQGLLALRQLGIGECEVKIVLAELRRGALRLARRPLAPRSTLQN